MKRNKKVTFVCLLFMIIFAIGIVGTLFYAKSNNQPATNIGQKGQTSAPPNHETGTSTTNSNDTAPPSLPNENNMSKNQMSQGGSISLNYIEMGIIAGCTLGFVICLLYLMASRFGFRERKEIFFNEDKKVIFALEVIILTITFTITIIMLTNKFVLTNKNTSNNTLNTTSVETKGTLNVTDKQTLNDKTYSTSSVDTSIVQVSNSGDLTLSNATLNKSSGDTSNTENSDFYGQNAGTLVKKNSTLTMSNSTITTNAKGANAVFATGENAKIKLSSTKITTLKDSSRGLDATYSGTIEANKVTISTSGAHCAAVATDRGGGTITVANSELNTSGEGSPSIYSTGKITVTKSTGLAKGSLMAVIEGKNAITLYDSNFTGYAYGRATGGIDNAGVMIYQSTSGDAAEGTGTFSATDSTLAISKESTIYSSAPMFFVTNTNAIINLTNTELTYGSNLLLSVSGNDGEWGTKGSNGGTITFNAINQTLKGNIEVDKISTATINLKNSNLTSTVNSANTAKNISLSLDSTSSWNVTGNSYIKTLILDSNNLKLIKDNGHTIYYDNNSNSWLNGKTVALQNGGSLKPM